MCSNHPKPVMFSSESVETSSLGHIPNPDGFIFWVRNDDILSWVKNHTRNVVVVTSASVNFPSLKKSKKITLLRTVMLFIAIKNFNDLVEEVADSITNMTRSLTLPNELCLGPKRSGTLLSLILHSLIWRSSAPETIKGIEGWNEAQFTPRSWPSRTCLTTQSAWPNRSVDPGVFMWSSRPAGPGATFFFLKPKQRGDNGFQEDFLKW